MCLTTSQNPSCWHPSWLNKACTTRKDSESEGLAKDNPETNAITIKPKTASHVAKQFPWILLLYCSPPGRPFPVKSLAYVSPQIIHFWVLGKSPLLGPGRSPPSCNIRSQENIINDHMITRIRSSILGKLSVSDVVFFLSWCSVDSPLFECHFKARSSQLSSL